MTTDSRKPESEASELLDIYLNDHRAGATAGVGLARRCLHNNSSNALGIYLAGLVTGIKQEIATLEDVMSRLETQKNPLKMVMARVAERTGRLKLNGQIFGYSPLSRVIELEALIAAVTAKARLWSALDHVADSYPELGGLNFADLRDRALEQKSQLEHHHDEAVALAFRPASVTLE